MLTVLTALAVGCPKAGVTTDDPRFVGTGTHTRTVTTSSPDAQRFFDLGLRQLYGFNHDEAIRSFTQALTYDPQCAMCAWGVALSNGPHINNPTVDDAHASAAADAVRKAHQGSHASDVERALVDAVASRYGLVERAKLDEAYAYAMKRVHDKYPHDDDVAALYAEALLDLRPWDQWTADGKMQPHTQEIIDVLDAVLTKSPLHPLANHLAVHVWEASPTPERAEPSATRLRTMAPALGHLVHMATHIDVRRGRFTDAVTTSQRAIEADRATLASLDKRGLTAGFYRFYVAHDEHMLAYAAMMTGQKAVATHAVREMVAAMPEAWMKENAVVADGVAALPLEVAMRFGDWDAILAAPDFSSELPISRGLRLAARATAFASKGALDDAKREERELADALTASAASGARFGNNSGSAVLDVAHALVAGEILVADQHVDEGVAALERAVVAEDSLRYDEPPDWMQPARHALGAVLVNAGRFADAERVYREDLKRVPDNGWSLLGLAQALEGQPDKRAEAAAVRARFGVAWASADVKPTTSCLCQHRP